MKKADRIAYLVLIVVFLGIELLLIYLAMDEPMSNFLMILMLLMCGVGLLCLLISLLIASNSLSEIEHEKEHLKEQKKLAEDQFIFSSKKASKLNRENGNLSRKNSELQKRISDYYKANNN